MRCSFMLPILGAALATAFAPTPLSAQETGMASMHAQRVVKGKICFVDHFHQGTGSGQSRKEAENAAISSWAGFTAWEYGSTWGSWRAAIAKGVDCSGSGASWQCSVEAIPCRPAGRRRR